METYINNRQNPYYREDGRQYMQNREPKPQSKLIPVAIVVAGIIIASAIVFKTLSDNKKSDISGSQATSKALLALKDIEKDDHVFGDRKASSYIIEYSDFECPFCKEMHPNLQALFAEYGPNGSNKLSWVYRTLWKKIEYKDASGKAQVYHPLGGKASMAAECLAEQGGDNLFFKFTHKIFSDDKNLESLDTFVKDLDSTINFSKYENCVQKETYREKIEKMFDQAVNAGIKGTPTTLLVHKDNVYPIVGGSISFENLKSQIDNILSQ